MDAFLQRAGAEIEAATGHLEVEEIARPREGKWSVAEILEHLTLTFRTNTTALEKALTAGETLSARPTVSQWLARTLVIDIGYFPRAQAPGTVVPTGSVSAERAREALRQALHTVDATLERAATRFGENTPLLKHAYFAGLTVSQWRKFHWRHVVHHMHQVQERTAGDR